MQESKAHAERRLASQAMVQVAKATREYASFVNRSDRDLPNPELRRTKPQGYRIRKVQ